MKTAIITDSTASIPKEQREELNIHMIPLSVIFGDEVYKDEIDITAEQFYEKVRNSKDLPTTSQPSVGEFVEVFERLAQEYDAAVIITLSSGISGTYQGAVSAASMVEGLDIHVYDSGITAMVQGFYVLEAARMAKEGKDPEEIIARLDEMKQSMRAYIVVDDLSHLQRGGRLSATQAFVGSLLQVKPILHFADGKVVPFEKVRTRKKALKRITELLDEDAKLGIPTEAIVIHANRLEEAEEFRAELSEAYPHVNFGLSYLGAVLGAHIGEGALVLAWYKK